MKFILAALLLVPSALMAAPAASAPTSAPAAEAPAHSFTVTGPGVATYPAFDQSVQRYGITTTDASTGTVTVVATTTDAKGTFRMNGRFAPHGTRTVKGLAANDEISVII